MRTLYFSLLFLSTNLLFSQKPTLQSGPMLGYVDMKEALVWVQTTGPAKVQMVYWDSTATGQKFFSEAIKTSKNDIFTAKLIADQVEPGRTYFYQIKINGKVVNRPYPTLFRTQKLWQYRTDPPNFSIAAGSCVYINEEIYDRPGKPYGSEYGIFNSIFNKNK